MKRVYLLRHAKSSWDDPNLADFDRTLNPRGRKDLGRLGNYMKTRRMIPEYTYCSPARRAKETFSLLSEHLERELPHRYENSIYEGQALDIINLLQQSENAYQSVLVIGHNPTLEVLGFNLTGEHHTMSTACLLAVDCPCEDWSKVSEDGRGSVATIICPRDITA